MKTEDEMEEDFVSYLLTKDKSAAVEIINQIANKISITWEDLENAREEPKPPFSGARWVDVAPMFGLNPERGIRQLPGFSVPRATLPPSFQKRIMVKSVQWLDVYGERDWHDKGAARVRLMDAV